MIAVAVAVIMAVILLTGGVVAESDIPGTLQFFGVTVRTTSAQIFLTGAICTWALLAAAWLLAAGIRRSRERSAQLAMLRGRAPSRVRDVGSATLANSAKPAVHSDRGERPGSGELPAVGPLPGHAQLTGHIELPEHTQLPGRSDLAGLFGFAARPGRLVTDRSGSGGGSDRADPGQNPAEQPPRR